MFTPAAVLVALLVAATTSAAPASKASSDPNDPMADDGNRFIVGLLYKVFDPKIKYTTNCVMQKQCPRTGPYTEANLGACVDCVMAQSTAAVKCYNDRGFSTESLVTSFKSIVYAIFLDGCRIDQVSSAACPTSVDMSAMEEYASASCPNPLTTPVPANTDSTAICGKMKCSVPAISQNKACARGAGFIEGMYAEYKQWLKC